MSIYTAVSICNSAISKIGAERISSLSDGTKAAIFCNEQYAKLRDVVTEAHPWSFAKARVSIAADVTAPTWGYDYRFALPADCLRVLNLDYSDIEYKVEGSYILSDESGPLNVLYIKQVTDTSTFTNNYAEALAFRIAADLSYPIAQSNTLQDVMFKAYLQQIKIAQSIDSQGSGTPDTIEANGWIDSRN